MKQNVFLLLIIVLISCDKDDVKPNIKESGFLENYLTNNPRISVLKTTDSHVVYTGGVATHRGYVFKPLADLKVTSFGGRIAEPGVYNFELFKLNAWWVSVNDTLLLDSINITNTSSFQYKRIDKEILLLKNEKYLIRYFNETHNSVYDAGIGWSPTDTTNYIRFPLVVDDVEIEIPYYTYHTKFNGQYWQTQAGTFNYGILRGLIDFKYELVK